MEKEFRKQFSQCPVCGSSERLCEGMAEELKERGVARVDWRFNYDHRNGVCCDPVKFESMPIGSELPSYGIRTDVCLNCGTIYAVDISKGVGKKSIEQVKGRLPQQKPERN